MTADDTHTNGWTAVPVSAEKIFESLESLSPPTADDLKDLNFPSEDPIVVGAVQFVQTRLSTEAFNHSMRVFYWGTVIARKILPQQFLALSPITWALTCLFHDIGTAEVFLNSTRMSFDIYGGIKAREVLQVLGSTCDQAEAVAEAIIRHEDMGVDGYITFMGQLIQLATLYDNVGVYEGIEGFGDLVHETTRDEVNKAFPRLRWCDWFAGTVREEERLKPWCHTTHIPQFDKKIEANNLQRRWE